MTPAEIEKLAERLYWAARKHDKIGPSKVKDLVKAALEAQATLRELSAEVERVDSECGELVVSRETAMDELVSERRERESAERCFAESDAALEESYDEVAKLRARITELEAGR